MDRSSTYLSAQSNRSLILRIWKLLPTLLSQVGSLTKQIALNLFYIQSSNTLLVWLGLPGSLKIMPMILNIEFPKAYPQFPTSKLPLNCWFLWNKHVKILYFVYIILCTDFLICVIIASWCSSELMLCFRMLSHKTESASKQHFYS